MKVCDSYSRYTSRHAIDSRPIPTPTTTFHVLVPLLPRPPLDVAIGLSRRIIGERHQFMVSLPTIHDAHG